MAKNTIGTDWNTKTFLTKDGDVDEGSRLSDGIHIMEYIPTSKLVKFTKGQLKKSGKGRWIYILVSSTGDEDTGHIGKKVYVKMGETSDDVLSRYGVKKTSSHWTHKTGLTYNNRMLEVFASDVGDDEIHARLQGNLPKGVVWQESIQHEHGSEEIYEISSFEALQYFIELVHFYANSTNEDVERKEMAVYKDTMDISDEIIKQCFSLYASGVTSPHINCDCCCRFGKTTLALVTWLKTNARILILSSYVGTVTDSYKSQVKEAKGYEDIMVVDMTHADLVDKMGMIDKASKWLKSDPDHRVLFLVPLTGTSDSENGEEEILDDSEEAQKTFENRTIPVVKFIKDALAKGMRYAIAVDEVDFGSKCPKQVKKINKISTIGGVKAIYRMSLSGTRANCAEVIWGKMDVVKKVTYFELEKIVAENLMSAEAR